MKIGVLTGVNLSFLQHLFILGVKKGLITVKRIMIPVHDFVKMNSIEEALIRSRPMRRLRSIHQLSLAYLIYPGATHRRFEHSLGVATVATDIFNELTSPEKQLDVPSSDVTPTEVIPNNPDRLDYYRQIVRLAALLHDVGHLPFSHTLEEFLPGELDHEYITARIIGSSYLDGVFARLQEKFPEREERELRRDVAKVAIGPELARYEDEDVRNGAPPLPWSDISFDAWERLLAEIIIGDIFGADRIDYLIRDATHTGVKEGIFDVAGLRDTLRILPACQDDQHDIKLGLVQSGVSAAEGLLSARYAMHKTIYFHHDVLVYDRLMQMFMREHPDFLNDEDEYTTDLGQFLDCTDVTILNALHQAAQDRDNPAHETARRIVEEDPPVVVSEETNAKKLRKKLEQALPEIRETLLVETVQKHDEREAIPVLKKDGSIAPLKSCSSRIENMPQTEAHFLYADRHKISTEDWEALQQQLAQV